MREKDERIDSLQKEVRKQVEDQQEIEELLNEKQSEIDSLNKDLVLAQKEKIEFENHSEELRKKLQTISANSGDEIITLQQQIEDLSEDNDAMKEDTKKLTAELKATKDTFEVRERESRETIEELRRQLATADTRLTEAANELLANSADNTDTNLLHNEILALREQLAELEGRNRSTEDNLQTSVEQLNASMVEYKVCLKCFIRIIELFE
jgi:chromosome segregation ATPase